MKIRAFLLISCAVLGATASCTPRVTADSQAQQVSAGGSGGINAPRHRSKPYVIMISFDGFRADYLDRYPAPTFARIAASGVRADGLIPVFPSKTFPNHYSIATGLTAEHHGIPANTFYDAERQAMYSIGNRSVVEDGSWYRGEPIWVTAERQGMVAASYFWVGSEADVGGLHPTIWKVFDGKVPNASRVDSVLAWLALPAERRPHMITLYMADVDDAGHDHGPSSPHVGAAILSVDSALARLVNGLQRQGLRDSTYLILVADHGMVAVTPQEFEAIDQIIDTAGVRIGDSGPFVNLYAPHRDLPKLRDELNRGLKHGRAYLRAEVPERLHYRADPRVGDIVVVMEQPWQAGLATRRPRRAGGNHGWDPTNNPQMYAIFLMSGPGIRRGARIPAFRNVEIYNMLTELLGLTPAPNDGQAGFLVRQVSRKRQ